MAVYLTVIPAEMLLGYAKELPGSELHNDEHNLNLNQHHIMVSLFDIKTGARLQKAKIRARVMSKKLTSAYKSMQLMLMGNVKSYGNFFSVPPHGAYEIELKIEYMGSKEISTVVFQYAST